MKLPILCAKCMQEDIYTAEEISKVEFNDNGLYNITCPKGHNSIAILQQLKFEVLFDIGMYAINDGYYREAVSSFAAAMERFHEFFITIVCLSRGIDPNEIQDTWKKVSKQSERQLGAYVFLHLIEYSSKPTLISPKNTEFRNDVVHKGLIPSKEQATLYAQAVFDVLKPALEKLKKNHEGTISAYVLSRLQSFIDDTNGKLPCVTLSFPTILSLAHNQPINNEYSMEKILIQRA